MLSEIPFNRNLKNQIVNIGSGVKTKISDIVRLLKVNYKKNLKVKYLKGTPLDQFEIISNMSKSKRIFRILKKTKLKKIDNFFRILK